MQAPVFAQLAVRVQVLVLVRQLQVRLARFAWPKLVALARFAWPKLVALAQLAKQVLAHLVLNQFDR